MYDLKNDCNYYTLKNINSCDYKQKFTNESIVGIK